MNFLKAPRLVSDHEIQDGLSVRQVRGSDTPPAEFRALDCMKGPNS